MAAVSRRSLRSERGRASASTAAAPRRRSRLGRWIRRAIALVVLVVVVAVAGIGVLVLQAPSVADAPGRVAGILAAHGDPSDDGVVPARVASALLATEDSRYYQDPFALDPLGVARAGLGVLTSNGRDGGATIEQQLAKMLYAPGTSIGAEFRQVGVAFRLDQHFTKRRILAMYLDAAYFGDGAYGITAAAHHYFGRPAGQLTWGQAALLAGLVQAPTAYDPHGHLAAALTRRAHVFDRLVATGVLTAAEARADAGAPLDPAVPFFG